jgi:hypothetical protein
MARRRRPNDVLYRVNEGCLCRRLCIFAFLVLIGVAPLQGGVVTLTPSNPTLATPPKLKSALGETAIADPATLAGSAVWNGVLSQLLSKQGFTEQNDWVYSFNNASPAFPAGVVQPTPLGDKANKANFSVLEYTLHLHTGAVGGQIVDNSLFGETMQFRLKFGNTVPPNPGTGYTVTAHWLQFINTDTNYNNFGYALAGHSGFWLLDNGRVPWVPGAGPFFDSNSTPGTYSVPPNFSDTVQYYHGAGTYLHFTTIPAWDVSNGGTVDWLVVGDTGLTWGFSISPEPSTILLATEFLVVAAVAGACLRQRRSVA